MKRILHSLLAILFLTSMAYAGTVTIRTVGDGASITPAEWNYNPTQITNALNGGLDNNNADTTNGFRFIEILDSLPAAGSQGRVIFNNDDDTLYFDTGLVMVAVAVLQNTQTFSGTTNTFSGAVTMNGTTTIDTASSFGGANTHGGIWFNNGSNIATELDAGTRDYFLQARGSSADPVWTSPTTVKTFTADGTFTAPNGISKVYLTMIGGGAGGAGAVTTIGGGGGGGGEAIVNRLAVVTGGTDYTVQVGVGGAGGAANADGTTGEDTIFDTGGAAITAKGGTKGLKGSTGGAGGTSGTSRDGVGKDAGFPCAIFDGGAGGDSATTNGGGGGGTIYGTGGVGASSGGNGTAAASGQYGAGGGGGGGNGGAGAAGADGIIVVMY